jgi:hypothetical protein
LTLKINKGPDSRKDYIYTKFGQNPLKDLDSKVLTMMFNIRQWILTKLGTYLVLRRVWNPVEFKVIGQRSRSLGNIFTV